MERAQVEKLLTLQHESPDVEFKGPGPRSDDYLRAKVARAVMGMVNKRGGGIVIIGVNERNRKPEGLSSNDVESWRNNDHVIDSLASYMEPPAIVELSIEEFQGKNFVFLVQTIINALRLSVQAFGRCRSS